jgi:exonuclease III
MSRTYTVFTLNIAGMSSPTRVGILNDFCRHHKFDIMLLQEVTHEEVAACAGYTARVNVGTDRRGTAILMRQQFTLDRIDALLGTGNSRALQGYVYREHIWSIKRGTSGGKGGLLQHRRTVFISVDAAAIHFWR